MLAFVIAVRIAFITSLQYQVTARLATLAAAGVTDVDFKAHSFTIGSKIDRVLRQDEEGLQWFDRTGRLVASRGLVPPATAPLLVNTRQPLRAGRTELQSYTSQIVDRFRHARGYVRASESSETYDATVRQLDIGLALGSLVALTATAFGGWLLSRQAVDRIDASFVRLREFTADASHELRGPVAAIASNATVALREEPALAARTKRRLETIADASAQMARLTDDLLLLARATVPLEREMFVIEVAEIVRGVRVLYEPEARIRGIAFGTESCEGLRAFGNPDQIGRVVGNLVENALRYTKGGGTVRVACETDKNWVYVRVLDSGIGIAPEHLDLIFERFWRASPARQHERGTGLGLAIARALARRHGGDVAASSEPGRGSIFTLTLPRRPPRA